MSMMQFTVILILAAICSSSSQKNIILQDVAQKYKQESESGYEFEMMDLLGLSGRPERMKRQPSLRNSASKFLLDVYHELDYEDGNNLNDHHMRRQKRELRESDNFITQLDRLEMKKCNNIISFSSKTPTQKSGPITSTFDTDMLLTFNTNDVPSDLQIVYSALRLYQDPSQGRFKNHESANTSISIYQKIFYRKQQTSEFKLLTSINATTMYKGWLEFNVTKLLAKWLKHRTLQHVIYGNQLLVGITMKTRTELTTHNASSVFDVTANDIGIVMTDAPVEDLQPFIIGYFNGPELMAKIQKLRFKREVNKRKRNANFNIPRRPYMPEQYKHPETCQRLNFTLGFKDDLHMHNWVIAPEKFEAFFCAGGCSFPLGSKMNATNHAIVQTLMHLRQPDLPKPCCVPTKLGSISILHYLNEDSVNLSKYPQSVAKECGCH